jgi:DNA-binding response OmpR family regulator
MPPGVATSYSVLASHRRTVRRMFEPCKENLDARMGWHPMQLTWVMATEKGLVVIVEDERPIAELERLYLTGAGFGVHLEREGTAGLSAIRRLKPAAVVLDVGLPGIDGIAVCRAMRDAGDWTPVIFVTARDDEVDRILGLELGGDDYITKPFSPRELVARIRAILRRQDGPPAAALRLGTVEIDLDTRQVRAGETAVALTATEFDLLARLMSAPDRVFSRESLLSSVWGHADYAAGRTVDVHVAQVRAKLGEHNVIRTTRGVGYSASESVR